MKNELKKISKVISSSALEINQNLKKYKDEIIVVKYGGSAMLDPKLSETFYKDIEIIVNAGIKPIIVIASNCNHPDLFKSCNLLAPTANTGIVVPNKTNTYATPHPLVSPSDASQTLAANSNPKTNKLNHQNSERLALPLKFA